LSEAPAEWLQQIFDVNFFGACRVNQTFLPVLKNNSSRIIHISSEAFRLTLPFMPYPLTKNLVERYAKVLRQELKYRGIEVVIVRPGAIDTSLLSVVSSLDQDKGRGDAPSKKWLIEKPFSVFARVAAKEIPRAKSPEKVASFIYGISGNPHPQAVYAINNSLKIRMAALIPFGLMEKIIRKILS